MFLAFRTVLRRLPSEHPRSRFKNQPFGHVTSHYSFNIVRINMASAEALELDQRDLYALSRWHVIGRSDHCTKTQKMLSLLVDLLVMLAAFE